MRKLAIHPAGDAAIMVDLGDRIDLAVNHRVHAVAERLRRELARVPGTEVVASYRSLLVSYDPMALSYQEVAELLQHAVEEGTRSVEPVRRFTLPVLYGGEFGPDLPELAHRHGLTPDEVIARHANRDYPIFCLGFSPGFPFLGGLDAALHTPRLATPRPQVPAGSVAIGGSQTGVYPTATPGGWHLIGRTPLTLFDVCRMPPVAYRPGDVMRFVPIDRATYEELRAKPALPQAEALEER